MNYRKLEDVLVGTIAGKPFNIIRTEDTEEFFAEAGTLEDKVIWKYIEDFRMGEVAMSNKYLHFNPITKQYFLTLDGVRTKQAVPQVLVDIIEESYSKNIDFTPVLKAWVRLLNNPRYTEDMAEYFAAYLVAEFVDEDAVKVLMEEQDLEEEVARAMCTYNDIAITKEGILVTYKVADIVTWKYLMEKQEDGSYLKVMKDRYTKIPAVLDETTGDVMEEESYEKPEHQEDYLFTPSIHKNGDKFYSGDKIGYVYEVGKLQSLPKSATRNLCHTFGGGGLYSGGLTYIQHYGNPSTQTLVCFVNPGDIISFQSEGQAFRTDAIFPNNIWDSEVPLKGIYHSSDYAALSDTRLEQLIAAALEDGVDLKDNSTLGE